LKKLINKLRLEINLLRKLDHRNIVRSIDAKKTKNFMYMFMEFCNEGTLEDLIMKNNDISETDILGFFR